MEKTSHITPFRLRLALVLLLPFHMTAHGFFREVAEVDSSASPAEYLAFHAPPRLNFADAPPVADRGYLLTLGNPVNAVEVLIDVEDNSSIETEFPIISYDSSDANESGLYQIPINVDTPPQAKEPTENILPPADPFVSSDDNTFDTVNNTDELMRLFENGANPRSNFSSGGFQFLPPYTIERGNMLVESKAKYTRKMRD